jgi:hypothetical protein
VALDPGVNLPAVHAAGSAHVGYDAEKCAFFEQTQSIHARFATDYGIAAALKSGLNICHHGGLILDEQHGQRLRS